MIAYGAFALACVAGVMYLVQERQLKTHQMHSIFYHLPPLTNLFAAITRLLWLGFALYTAGLVSGFFTGRALAAGEDDLRLCGLAFLRRNPAGTALAPARAETDRGALRARV